MDVERAREFLLTLPHAAAKCRVGRGVGRGPRDYAGEAAERVREVLELPERARAKLMAERRKLLANRAEEKVAARATSGKRDK